MGSVLALYPVPQSRDAMTLGMAAAFHALLFAAAVFLIRAPDIVAPPPPGPDIIWVIPQSVGGGSPKGVRPPAAPDRKQPRKKPTPTQLAQELPPAADVQPEAAPALEGPLNADSSSTGDASTTPGTGNSEGPGPGEGEPGTGRPGGDLEAAPEPIPISADVEPPRILERVEPDYPVLARRVNVEGIVSLRCIIAQDGSVEVLKVQKGHPLLRDAAVDAVSQWRYEPATFQGRPVSVYMTVTVEFSLD